MKYRHARDVHGRIEFVGRRLHLCLGPLTRSEEFCEDRGEDAHVLLLLDEEEAIRGFAVLHPHPLRRRLARQEGVVGEVVGLEEGRKEV